MLNKDSDKQWGLFNKKLEELMKVSDFYSLGTTYYEMAEFLEKEGKDASHLRRFGYEMKLRVLERGVEDYDKSGVVKSVEVFATPHSCELCKKLNGKVFSIQDAKTSKPLPVEGCTYSLGCRCTYLPVIE